MDAYLPVAGEKIAEALERSKTLRIEVYGNPGPVTQEVLRRNAEQGASVTVKPIHLSGFTRPAAA